MVHVERVQRVADRGARVERAARVVRVVADEVVAREVVGILDNDDIGAVRLHALALSQPPLEQRTVLVLHGHRAAIAAEEVRRGAAALGELLEAVVVRRRGGAVDGVDDRHRAEERQRDRVARRDGVRQLRREIGVGGRRGRRRERGLLATRRVEQRAEVGVDLHPRDGDAGDEASRRDIARPVHAADEPALAGDAAAVEDGRRRFRAHLGEQQRRGPRRGGVAGGVGIRPEVLRVLRAQRRLAELGERARAPVGPLEVAVGATRRVEAEPEHRAERGRLRFGDRAAVRGRERLEEVLPREDGVARRLRRAGGVGAQLRRERVLREVPRLRGGVRRRRRRNEEQRVRKLRLRDEGARRLEGGRTPRRAEQRGGGEATEHGGGSHGDDSSRTQPLPARFPDFRSTSRRACGERASRRASRRSRGRVRPRGAPRR